jgi:hypothetical protein
MSDCSKDNVTTWLKYYDLFVAEGGQPFMDHLLSIVELRHVYDEIINFDFSNMSIEALGSAGGNASNVSMNAYLERYNSTNVTVEDIWKDLMERDLFENVHSFYNFFYGLNGIVIHYMLKNNHTQYNVTVPAFFFNSSYA